MQDTYYTLNHGFSFGLLSTMLPENTKHPNLESAMYNVLIFGSPELTGSCQPLSALPKRPAVGCRNPVKGCGRLPWSAIHSNNFLCFDLQASQASNLRKMASFWSQKYSKLAPVFSLFYGTSTTRPCGFLASRITLWMSLPRFTALVVQS